MGVFGVFAAAMMSGLNSRIGALSLIDVKTGFGLGADEGSWIGSLYSAFELAAMPFATWFAVTFSFRRFHVSVVVAFSVLGLLTPLAPRLEVLLALRCLQGFMGGLLIPVLMAAALRFFPLPLRLYGLALYAMTATFSPNVATWLSATYTDTLSNWHLAFWQIIPLAIFSVWAVAWGIPQDPIRLERLKSLDWIGLASGVCGLVCIGLGLTQGERYDWFNDTLIVGLFCIGSMLLFVFLLAEWFHPLPFIKLQLLHRRNLGLGFTIFIGLVVVLLSGSLAPAQYLAEVHGFRTPYIAGIGLSVGLPQIVCGPAVSFLLYKRWIDARHVFAVGLACLGASCLVNAHLTSQWIVHEFLIGQTLQALGQPMAVISLLFLATSVVQPMEGPVVSGIINMFRAFGTLLGDALLERVFALREKMHANIILDSAASNGMLNPAQHATTAETLGDLAERISRQAFVLTIADAYLILGTLAALLIPLVLNLQYVKPPVLNTPSR
ncbi:MFS transporter (plasmid) [Paraburkholderia terrae]|uniref:MFS transporter n=2 Tax=Paraburkholderia terrae TaxID=311230 RepID=A0ABM7UB43_9BURK|nr:MFS transporter [Paraburkholderia terrae]